MGVDYALNQSVLPEANIGLTRCSASMFVLLWYRN